MAPTTPTPLGRLIARGFSLPPQVRHAPGLMIIGDRSAAITTGIKGDLVLPEEPGLIVGWTLLADQTGSIVLDAWMDSYANYPPVVGDTIWGTKPALSSGIKNQATGLSIAFLAGAILRWNVDSATTVTQVTISLDLQI